MKDVFHVHVLSQSPAVLASFLVVFGLVALATPLFAGADIVVFLSWLLIFSGLTKLAYASCLPNDARIAKRIVFGSGLYVGAGVWLRTTSAPEIPVLVLVLMVFFLAYGLIAAISCLSVPKNRGSKPLVVGGLVTMISVILIWQRWPASSDWALGALVGVSMSITGAVHLLLAIESAAPSERDRIEVRNDARSDWRRLVGDE